MNGNTNGVDNGCSSPRRGTVLYKTFSDPIHGQMELHPACVAIIDTAQFQRLRNIRQTGFCEYVFPGATHNRFCHSLGVCYLAGKFICDLRNRQPELSISDVDVLCVQLAGLCHDLGHGPFSHSWEKFMNNASRATNYNHIWKHEYVSIKMLDFLIEENNLVPVLKSYGIGLNELKLIKDYITGVEVKDSSRAFLHQIVNNDDSGLDVDKWDYFLRDCHYLGLKCGFEYERLIQCAKVLIVNGKLQICFRDKAFDNVYNTFRTRSNLHLLAYQHKVILTISQMIQDALIIADGKIMGPSQENLQFWEWSMAAAKSNGNELKEALKKFCMLTDDLIISSIKHTPNPEVLKAVNILKSIERRSCKTDGFYQHVGLKMFPFMVNQSEVKNEIWQLLSIANHEISSRTDINLQGKCDLVTLGDIRICIAPISWGKGDKNPVDFVHFYSKNSVIAHSSSSLQKSSTWPRSFYEDQVHVLCTRNDDFAIKVVKLCFEKFCNGVDCKNCDAL